ADPFTTARPCSLDGLPNQILRGDAPKKRLGALIKTTRYPGRLSFSAYVHSIDQDRRRAPGPKFVLRTLRGQVDLFEMRRKAMSFKHPQQRLPRGIRIRASRK